MNVIGAAGRSKLVEKALHFVLHLFRDRASGPPGLGGNPDDERLGDFPGLLVLDWIVTFALRIGPPSSRRDEPGGEVTARIAQRVSPNLPENALARDVIPEDGDHSLNSWEVSPDFLETTRVAAVLVGLVEREDGLHVLLTQRGSTLRVHSGQIAFPGGKMDPEDASPAAAALRQ